MGLIAIASTFGFCFTAFRSMPRKTWRVSRQIIWALEAHIKRHLLTRLGSDAHMTLFRFAASFHPIYWTAFTIVTPVVLYAWWLDSYEWPALWIFFWISVGPLSYLMLRMTMATHVIPVRQLPSVVAEARPGRVLALHLEHEMPANGDIVRIVEAIVRLMCELNFKKVEMRSPLLGDASKADLWCRALSRAFRNLGYFATVQVVDRTPLTRSLSERYLATYDRHRRRAIVIDGRVSSAKLTISDLTVGGVSVMPQGDAGRGHLLRDDSAARQGRIR